MEALAFIGLAIIFELVNSLIGFIVSIIFYKDDFSGFILTSFIESFFLAFFVFKIIIGG